MSYNRLQTMRDNIEAIRLALRLGVAGRSAQTPACGGFLESLYTGQYRRMQG